MHSVIYTVTSECWIVSDPLLALHHKSAFPKLFSSFQVFAKCAFSTSSALFLKSWHVRFVMYDSLPTSIPCTRDYNPLHSWLQSHVLLTSIPCTPDFNPLHSWLQSSTLLTSILYTPDFNPLHSWLQSHALLTSILYTTILRVTALRSDVIVSRQVIVPAIELD